MLMRYRKLKIELLKKELKKFDRMFDMGVEYLSLMRERAHSLTDKDMVSALLNHCVLIEAANTVTRSRINEIRRDIFSLDTELSIAEYEAGETGRIMSFAIDRVLTLGIDWVGWANREIANHERVNREGYETEDTVILDSSSDNESNGIIFDID